MRCLRSVSPSTTDAAPFLGDDMVGVPPRALPRTVVGTPVDDDDLVRVPVDGPVEQEARAGPDTLLLVQFRDDDRDHGFAPPRFRGGVAPAALAEYAISAKIKCRVCRPFTAPGAARRKVSRPSARTAW